MGNIWQDLTKNWEGEPYEQNVPNNRAMFFLKKNNRAMLENKNRHLGEFDPINYLDMS